jgi:hypothetical protein
MSGTSLDITTSNEKVTQKHQPLRPMTGHRSGNTSPCQRTIDG